MYRSMICSLRCFEEEIGHLPKNGYRVGDACGVEHILNLVNLIFYLACDHSTCYLARKVTENFGDMQEDGEFFCYFQFRGRAFGASV